MEVSSQNDAILHDFILINMNFKHLAAVPVVSPQDTDTGSLTLSVKNFR